MLKMADKSWYCKIENIFAIFCLFFGLVFAFVIPPFQVSDESSHFVRMYSILDGQYAPVKIKASNGEIWGGSICPTNLGMVAKAYDSVTFDLSKKVYPESVKYLSSIELEKDKSSWVRYFVPSYGPLSYMPGLPVLQVMKWLNVKPLFMMYILRIVNLLSYICLCYFAIKTTPIRKWLFALCAMLPAMITLAAGVSTDGIVVGIFFLTTAYIFRLASDKLQITTKRFWLLTLVFSLLVMLKFPYSFLGLLLFILDKEQFVKNKYSTIFKIAIIPIFVVLWTVVSSSIANSGIKPMTAILPMNLVLDEFFAAPYLPLVKFINTIRFFGENMFLQSLATFGWNNVYPAFWVGFIYFMCLFFAGLLPDNEDEFRLNFKSKILCLSIYLGFALTLAMVCYLLFSFAGDAHLRNYQGRYFIPLLPLLFLTLSCYKIKMNNTKALKVITLMAFGILTVLCIIFVILRFYVI